MQKVEINEYLDNVLKDFFPESGCWRGNCFRREELVSESNLPCHLRDVDWITSLIMKKYNLYSLGEVVIKEYVSNSLYFNSLRSEYEQRIVKWQIDWMMHDGSNWIVDGNLGGDLYVFSSKCDYAFRKGVVDTLLAIGMDINAIEEGIEKNADMWRDQYMNLAFSNEFDPIFNKDHYRILGNNLENETNVEKLEDPESEFKEKWLAYRKYQYYQEHKESVDRYGAPTLEMLMRPEEVKRLAVYLEEKSLERHRKIEEYMKRKSSNPRAKQVSQPGFYQLSYQVFSSDEKEEYLLKRLVKKIGLIKKNEQ